MACEFKLTRRVEFSETDLAGIMHFSNYFKFMEAAEHAFFRSLGFSIHTVLGGTEYGWPRVHADCHYRAPLTFEDEVAIHLRVRRVTRKSLSYTFEFKRLAAEGSAREEVVAHGELTVVCVTRDAASGAMRAVAIPEAILARIEPAPERSREGELAPS